MLPSEVAREYRTKPSRWIVKLFSLGATVLLTIAWGSWQRFCQYRRRMFANLNIKIVTQALPILLASCASYGPYHPNTSAQPLNSVRGPEDGRYKLAFIEFGDQGSALDTSQRAAALGVIRKADRPLLFVYIHGWH